MITHHHTRSDYCKTYSPRIPSPPEHLPLTSCSPYIERRIRRLLCWHAGAAGLINDQAVQYIGDMYFAGEVSTADLKKLASEEVHLAISRCINERTAARRAYTEG